MSARSIRRPDVSSVRAFGPCAWKPSSFASSSSSLAAIRSIRLASSASVAVTFSASVTVLAASSPFRSCPSASARA